MLRAATIVATIVALFLGSLDLPLYVHACSMMEETRVAPTCGMCTHEDDRHEPTVSGSAQTGPMFEPTPCCRQEQIDRAVEPSMVTKLDFLSPCLLLDFHALHSAAHQLWTVQQVPPTWMERPPPLDARAQATYLINSVFLI